MASPNEFHALFELLTMLVLHPRTGVLIALLLLAAVIDWRTLRIPNWLTFGGMLFGVAYNAFESSPARGGATGALAGLALGAAALLPLYALRVLGAGDVKLMAMVGAFLGIPSTLHALLYSLMAGGVLALSFTVYHKAFRQVVMNLGIAAQMMRFAPAAGRRAGAWLASGPSIGKMPYGPAIAAGTVTYLVIAQL